MFRLAVGFVILSALTIGFLSFANAEQVDIPFVPQGRDCILTEDTHIQRFACVWIAEKPKGISVKQDNLTEQEIQLLEEIKEAKENGTYVQPPEDVAWKGPTDFEKDEFEEFLDRMNKESCGKENPRPADLEICALTGHLAECQRGTRESAPVQERSNFIISEMPANPNYTPDLHDQYVIKKLYMAKEECIAQMIELQPRILGAQYLHLSQQPEGQMYHGEIAKELTPFQSQRIDDYDFYWQKAMNYQAICGEDSIYQDNTKKELGCVGPVYEGELPNPDKQVEYSSTAYAKYMAYKNDPINFEPDQMIYGKVGDWKVQKGKQR
jgi:hypothetical protein